MTFPQYTTSTFGSTLSYSFKGVHTQMYGAVGPSGGEYVVTLDGVPQKALSSYNHVAGNDVVLWFAQELNNDKTHTVTITNLGGKLEIQAIQYTELFPYTSDK
ncbi:hypothetical protein CALCODRAFT_499215 [Calocera cornea HHB12733]|uniref:Uncharacterized protein n=1 Tax=Calocera cornea HHB12733 TaxID=1353952 RepID=A0A165EHZ9_9BASI|nr:hypothetical protein CALCODRAFT_499215 [Calocera cornea HHB12733]